MRRWILGLTLVGVVAAAPMLRARQAVLYVDDDATPSGNGTSKKPFQTIADAIAAAQGFSERVLINVAPGDYPQSSTLVINRSMELRGSTIQRRHGGQFPSGDADPDTATRIYADFPAPDMTDLIRVEGPSRSTTSDVTIRGFIFDSNGFDLQALLLLLRTQGFRVSDNILRGTGTWGLLTAGSSGDVISNHFSSLDTGAVISGGWIDSPADVVVRDNRMVQNSLGGLVLGGAAYPIEDPGDLLTAEVRDNDLSENTGNSQGFGLRIMVIRREPEVVPSLSAARVSATVQGNRIVLNQFGVVVDAGFPFRRWRAPNTGICDLRAFTGELDLFFRSNEIDDSLTTDGFISFTRYTASMREVERISWKYLSGATFTISDPDGSLEGATVDHRAVDPFIGPCPGDATNEALNNVLNYNGQPVATGTTSLGNVARPNRH